jgi:sugar phosphate isomerase/epimerase
MKIAISNIAWDMSEQDAIKRLMLERDVRGVEIAPTKVWNDPQAVSIADMRSYRHYWQDSGIDIVALQSLLFGHPEMTIFDGKEQREQTSRYLRKMIDIAAELGAKVLVFGSPKNRSSSYTDSEENWRVAVDFFRDLGEYAHSKGVFFCIEPNPRKYECTFVCDTNEALKLVKAVNSPGFRLHLDAAIMTLNEETIDRSIASGKEYLCHFHISQPQLAPVGRGDVDHQAFARVLKELNYDRWTSVEMRAGAGASNTDTVRSTLDYVVSVYG